MSTLRIWTARREKRPSSTHRDVHKFTVALGPTPDVNELPSIPHRQNHEHTHVTHGTQITR